MTSLLCSLLSLLLLTGLAVAVEDFVDGESGGFWFLRHEYQFIYHDNHDLLLVVDDANCWYVSVPENENTEVKYLQQQINQTEKYILNLIHSQSRALSSDLEHVRDQFADRLADFHCLDKHIYTLPLNLDDMSSILPGGTSNPLFGGLLGGLGGLPGGLPGGGLGGGFLFGR